MDSEKRARRQSIRLIVSEAIMVIAVVAMVVVLAFLVSGYWLGSGFQVERQGMLQISSVPTGATVAVDGEAPWYQRTNTSKVLVSGEHVVSLNKDGYDSWTRTINIRDGLLYRINYPRLFLLEREKETMLDSSTTTVATISPDHKWMLLIDNTTTWQLINLFDSELKPKTISVATLFSSVSMAVGATNGLFTSQISSINWSGDNEHLLIHSRTDNTNEWVILNVKNPLESVNITREFATSFDDIRIFDNSAGILLATKGTNLHKIDISSRQISAVLVEKVHNYSIFGAEIIYTADTPTNGSYDSSSELLYRQDEDFDEESLDLSEEAPLENKPEAKYYTGIIKINEPDQISYVTSSDELVRAFVSRFYDEKYITVVSSTTLSVYKYENGETVFESTLSFNPDKIKMSYDGEFVLMNSGSAVQTFDMEALEIREWTFDAENFGWLDGHTVYSVKDGTLIVYDFDGLNRRTLSNNVSAHFPVTISDNKWLYYFSDDTLIRETIAQ